MRGWSVLGSVLLMGSSALVWSLLMTRCIDSKAYAIFSLHWTLKERQRQDKTEEGRVGQVEQVVRCGLSCLSHHRHLRYGPSMMALVWMWHLMWRGFTSAMTWFHVASINYPFTEGTPLHNNACIFFLVYFCFFIIAFPFFPPPPSSFGCN